jgi:hypothetical protein
MVFKPAERACPGRHSHEAGFAAEDEAPESASHSRSLEMAGQFASRGSPALSSVITFLDYAGKPVYDHP